MTMFCRTFTVALLLAGFGVAAQADTEGNGLKTPGGDAVWPRWQARMLVSLATPLWRQDAWENHESQGLRVESLGLLGDYYFGRSLLSSAQAAGGFRATSGLIIGATTNRALSAYGQTGSGRTGLSAGSALPVPGSPGDFANTATVPYLGIGYTSVSARGGWGFSADIGLVAQNPGSVVKFGRFFSGAQTLDEVLRDMRLSPLLNVGVSYSF